MSGESPRRDEQVRIVIPAMTSGEQVQRLLQLCAISAMANAAYGEYPTIGTEPDGGGRFRAWLTGLGWIVRGPVRGVRRQFRL